MKGYVFVQVNNSVTKQLEYQLKSSKVHLQVVFLLFYSILFCGKKNYVHVYLFIYKILVLGDGGSVGQKAQCSPK